MKDLTDFIAVGKELGLTTDKLSTFARTEYDKYLKALEVEDIKEKEKRQNEEAKYERELRLLERKAQIAADEKEIAAAESSGSGGSRASPCIQIYAIQ